MGEDKTKRLEFGYRINILKGLRWEFPALASITKIFGKFLLIDRDFHFAYANMVTISHSNESEFSLYFTDFFPFQVSSSDSEEPQTFFPKIRIIYPATDIEALLLLCEKVLGLRKSTQVDDVREDFPELKLLTTVTPQIPYYFANTAHIYLDLLSGDYRIVFGEELDVDAEVTLETESEKKAETVKKIFLASKGLIIPGNIFKSMVDALKTNIGMYHEKYGELPLKSKKEGESSEQ